MMAVAKSLSEDLPLSGQAADLVLVAAEREPFVQEAVQLPLEFADASAVLGGLDLVEAANVGSENWSDSVGPIGPRCR